MPDDSCNGYWHGTSVLDLHWTCTVDSFAVMRSDILHQLPVAGYTPVMSMLLPRTLTLSINPCIKPLVLSATLTLPAAILVAPRLGEASYILLAVLGVYYFLQNGVVVQRKFASILAGQLSGQCLC